MLNLDINGYEDQIVQNITGFIETQTKERGIDGVLIMFSGYVDSTIIAKLALDTLKDMTVKLFLRQEKFSKNQEEILNESIEFLGLEEENIVKHDIEPMIEQLKSCIPTSGSTWEISTIYEHLSYELLKITAKDDILEKTYGMIGTAETEREKSLLKILARNKIRSRIRMATAYFTAEQENLFLLGSINKTELLTGLYTKWGHGHCADLMILGNLFRTQILQLAEYMNIPEIIRSSAKSDLIPGIQNKYEYFFDLSSKDVDRVLIRLEQGHSPEFIQEKTGILQEAIRNVIRYYNSSSHIRAAPMIPKI
ncbi:MAG: NAD(+) synthase [Candidatus Hodarchaeales archaeon]|jgi:NAD+ synthase